jgi:hypothetical protein
MMLSLAKFIPGHHLDDDFFIPLLGDSIGFEAGQEIGNPALGPNDDVISVPQVLLDSGTCFHVFHDDLHKVRV